MTVGLRERLTALHTAVAHLDDALTALRCTVVEDEPSPSHAIVTAFADAVDDLWGWLQEAASAVRALPGEQADAQQVWEALELSQAAVDNMTRRLTEDLLAYDVVDRLSELGRERGREWAAWSTTVRRGLDQVQSQLRAVSAALLACWKELAERSGSTWVSVRAVNIGQQVGVTASELSAEGFP